MAPNPRVTKAFHAMKALGIPEDKVKPVLKKLLKLYDKKWDLIEEENYRVLADAIFEEDDTEVLQEKREESVLQEKREESDDNFGEEQVLDEPERPLKRLRRGHEGRPGTSSHNNNNNNSNNSSSAREIPLKEPKLEAEELPDPSSMCQASKMRKSHSGINSHSGNTRNTGMQLVVQESSNPSPQRIIDKGKQPLIASDPLKEKRPIMGRPSPGIRFKDPEADRSFVPVPKQKLAECQALIKPKEEPFTDELPLNHLPLAVIMPDSSSKKHSSAQNISNGRPENQLPPAPHSVAEDRNNDTGDFPGATRTNGNDASGSMEHSANLEIATSLSGEVKLSLSYTSFVGRLNFHLPGQDELLKSMQEKCLRSYKIEDPNFSVMQMLKDMCDCFVVLATDHSHESQESFIKETPDLDMACGGIERNNCVPGGTPKGLDADCSSPLAAPQSPRLAQGLDDLQNRESNKDDLVVPESQLAPEEIKARNLLNDITKGEEVIEVPWINEVNNEFLPLFKYIPRSLVFQNADVMFTLSQIGAEHCCAGCMNDCLTSPTSCVCSSVSVDGFAYTPNGLLKEDFLEECISMTRDPQRQCLSYCKDCPLEDVKNYETYEPCKGHLKRKYIKECWIKCGCHNLCGNRVVQRGIRCKLQVFFTPDGKGWGLRTLDSLPKGAFVCEYVGEILTNEELHERKRARKSNTNRHAYAVLLDTYWFMQTTNRNDKALCLDATFYGNVARFINHRCLDANLIEIPVKIETPDHHYYHLALFTTREVNALEELTWDYGVDFGDNDRPVETFCCLCGSNLCRNMKSSSSGAGSKSAIGVCDNPGGHVL